MSLNIEAKSRHSGINQIVYWNDLINHYKIQNPWTFLKRTFLLAWGSLLTPNFYGPPHMFGGVYAWSPLNFGFVRSGSGAPPLPTYGIHGDRNEKKVFKKIIVSIKTSYWFRKFALNFLIEKITIFKKFAKLFLVSIFYNFGLKIFLKCWKIKLRAIFWK